jgi:hypothetical protein
MLLQDLPEKTSRRLLKSVNWTEVEGPYPIKHWLRGFVSRVAPAGRWVRSVRKVIASPKDDGSTTRDTDDRGSAP